MRIKKPGTEKSEELRYKRLRYEKTGELRRKRRFLCSRKLNVPENSTELQEPQD